jgi:hypothetical protein
MANKSADGVVNLRLKIVSAWCDPQAIKVILGVDADFSYLGLEGIHSRLELFFVVLGVTGFIGHRYVQDGRGPFLKNWIDCVFQYFTSGMVKTQPGTVMNFGVTVSSMLSWCYQLLLRIKSR